MINENKLIYSDRPIEFDDNQLKVNEFVVLQSNQQINFNKTMKNVLYRQNTIILFVDYDVDGGVSARQFIDLIKLIGSNNVILTYVSPCKSHSIDSDFIEYVRTSSDSRIKPVVIVTDSSTHSLPQMRELATIADIIHIDHHQTDTETEKELSSLCIYHSNCLAESNISFHNLSAGMYIALLIASFIKTETDIKNSYIEICKFLSLGTLSLVADVCDTQKPYNKSILNWFKNCICLHPILQGFTTNYTLNNLEFLAFTVAPKINMLFRLQFTDLIKTILEIKPEECEEFVERVNQQYANFKSYINNTYQMLKIIDYGNLAFLDITVVEELFPLFKGKLSNLTGWYANLISQQLAKPCIVVCEYEPEMYKCSARNVKNVPIFNILNNLPYIQGGGHPCAYGFTIEEKYMDNLIYDFHTSYKETSNDFISLTKLDYLYELVNYSKNGVLKTYCDYNFYTLNNRVGFLYTIRESDLLIPVGRRLTLDIQQRSMDIISFDMTVSIGNTVLLIPTHDKTKTKIVFSKFEENIIL